tara:strand:+ start:10836 stop:11099 length:264 start_codon:yes stop_codon:yes gene_type:complete
MGFMLPNLSSVFIGCAECKRHEERLSTLNDLLKGLVEEEKQIHEAHRLKIVSALAAVEPISEQLVIIRDEIKKVRSDIESVKSLLPA